MRLKRVSDGAATAARISPRTTLTTFLLTLLLAFGAAAAQQDAPAGEGAAPAEPTPEQPEDPERVTPPARLRVAHLAPNAPSVEVALYPLTGEDADEDGEDDRGAEVAPDALSGLAYGETTDFFDVPAGTYDVVVSADGTPVVEQSGVDLSSDVSYTVAAVGLVLPDDLQQQDEEEEEGGFLGFIRNLFGDSETERDALELQLVVLRDDLDRSIADGETLVRVLHASPGTEPVALAVAGEEGTLISGVEFGEASRYRAVQAAPDQLEVRVGGSRAATIEIANAELEAGTIATVAVIGTSLEQAPIETVVLSDPPRTESGEDAAAGTTDAGTDETGGASGEGTEVGSAPTLDALVGEQDDLTTLTAALEQAGLMQALAGSETYTLFAPTDAAFETLSQEQLDALLADSDALGALLSNHVVEGRALPSSALAEAGEIATAGGGTLRVPGDGTVGDAAMVAADLQAANGVLHKIDTLLLPADFDLPAPTDEGEGGDGA